MSCFMVSTSWSTERGQRAKPWLAKPWPVCASGAAAAVRKVCADALDRAPRMQAPETTVTVTMVRKLAMEPPPTSRSRAGLHPLDARGAAEVQLTLIDAITIASNKRG